MTAKNLTLLFAILLLQLNGNTQEFHPADYIKIMPEPARVYKVCEPSDSFLLSSMSLPVQLVVSEKTKILVSLMYRTVTDSLSAGVGIAAPQIGVSQRVILVQRFDKPNQPFEAYINPEIIQYSQLQAKRQEGCLSIDDVRLEVERPYAVLLSYFTVKGEHRMEMVEDFTARIFQHEIDHLNGILFPQRVFQKE